MELKIIGFVLRTEKKIRFLHFILISSSFYYLPFLFSSNSVPSSGFSDSWLFLEGFPFIPNSVLLMVPDPRVKPLVRPALLDLTFDILIKKKEF